MVAAVVVVGFVGSLPNAYQDVDQMMLRSLEQKVLVVL